MIGKTFEVTIAQITRVISTPNGNPRFLLDLDTSTHDSIRVRTKDDAAFAFTITESMIGKRAMVTISNGRATGLEIIDD